MSTTAKPVTKKRETNVPSQSLEVDDISISFFNDGNGDTINIGIGTEISPSVVIESSAAHNDDQEQPEPVAPLEPVADDEPIEADCTDEPDIAIDSGIFSDEDNTDSETNKEDTNLDIPLSEPMLQIEDGQSNTEPEPPLTDNIDADIIERSAKLLEETKSWMKNHQVNLPEINFNTHPQSQKSGLLTLPDVEADIPIIDDADKLDEQYRDLATPVKEKIVTVEVDKVTAADRAGKAVNWLTDTFIVSPVKGLFRALHNGIVNFIGFIGSLLKFVLISTVATVGIYIIIAHYSDSGLSPYEMAIQHYEAIKKIIVTLYNDIFSEVRGKDN
ncbi:hypothetical protein [Thermicanus aegyptius]|uniref:hypothetical protein n=1 Tax=Thermicanus aegyptius TaxID=94009 RepID=UPI0004169E14|nr:hypothetical protein [Thermicanus aegyptius]